MCRFELNGANATQMGVTTGCLRKLLEIGQQACIRTMTGMSCSAYLSAVLICAIK